MRLSAQRPASPSSSSFAARLGATLTVAISCSGASAQLADTTTLRGLSLGVKCEKSKEELRASAIAAGASILPGAKYKGADEYTPPCSRGPDETVVGPAMLRVTPGVITDAVRTVLNPVNGTVEAVHSETTWHDLPNGTTQRVEALEAALVAKFGKPSVVGKSETGARLMAFSGGNPPIPTSTTTEAAFDVAKAKLFGTIAVAEFERKNGRVVLQVVLRRQVTEPPSIML